MLQFGHFAGLSRPHLPHLALPGMTTAMSQPMSQIPAVSSVMIRCITWLGALTVWGMRLLQRAH